MPQAKKPKQSSAAYAPVGLKYAASFLPGGTTTMIWLAWHSRDERVRDVAKRWRVLDTEQRERMDLEALCDEADLRDGDFLGAVLGTAFEFRIDISPVIGGITAMPQALMGLFSLSIRSEAGDDQVCQAIEFFNRRFRVKR